MIKERIEPISPEEHRTLIKRGIGAVIASIVIAAVFIFIVAQFSKVGGGFGSWIPIVFGIFFFGVMGFILYVHIQSIFETQKIIQTGRVMEKRSDTSYSSSMRTGSRSSSTTYYYITLEDKEMSVDLWVYNQLQKGELVELHKTKKTKNIIKVVSLEAAPAEVTATSPAPMMAGSRAILGESYTEMMDSDEQELLRKRLIKAAFWRVLIGGAAAYAIRYIIMVVMVVFFLKNNTVFDSVRIFAIYLPWAIAILLFALLNRFTLKLFLDMRGGMKTVVTETVKDVVTSNALKPGPNSTITSSARYDNRYYYYLQTAHHWFLITPELANRLKAGDVVTIHQTPNAKFVLKAE